MSLDELLPSLYSSSVSQMSLSLMYEGLKMEKSFTVSIQPMELYSFLLTRYHYIHSFSPGTTIFIPAHQVPLYSFLLTRYHYIHSIFKMKSKISF